MDFIREAHSGWRYIVILVSIVVLAKYLYGWFSKGEWRSLDQRLGTSFPIVYDIQLLLGLVLWIMQRRWTGADSLGSWEHPVTMILAIAVAHIGWTRTKKVETSADKFRTASIWFLVAAILMGLGVARITGVV